jgi:phosphatidylglycerophosphatase C
MKTIIATDFDGTLTTADTLLRFIRFACGNVRFVLVFTLYLPLIVLMKMRVCPNWKLKQKVFSRFFRGMDAELFDRKCRDYAAKDRHILRPGGVEMIRKAQADGAEVVIVSASMENWVQPFFPDVRVIGTRIEVKDGSLTGRFSTNNCYGAEKVRRLLEAFPDRENYRLVAYGDSGGDRELLAIADERHFKPWRNA